MSKEDDAKKFVDWFNAERVRVGKMSIEELRQRRDELSAMALEARSEMSACDDELRERNRLQKRRA